MKKPYATEYKVGDVYYRLEGDQWFVWGMDFFHKHSNGAPRGVWIKIDCKPKGII